MNKLLVVKNEPIAQTMKTLLQAPEWDVVVIGGNPARLQYDAIVVAVARSHLTVDGANWLGNLEGRVIKGALLYL